MKKTSNPWTVYECWTLFKGKHPVDTTFSTRENIRKQRKNGLIAPGSKLTYTIVARSWADAMTQHYRKQGWGAYKP